MKLAYITVRIPYGEQETFIIPEVTELLRQHQSVAIFPFRPTGVIYHDDARALENHTCRYEMFSTRIAIMAFCCYFKRPVTCSRLIGKVLSSSRNLKTGLLNLTATVKALALADRFVDLGIEHIHAHWGTRPSTFALLVSELTGIPWSMTLHRWDIYENNLLRQKSASASFVRCISEKGKSDLMAIAGDEFVEKIKVIRLGVTLPARRINLDNRSENNQKNVFNIVVPANLYGVKGHKYLINAIELLVKDGMQEVKCRFYGDGYLREELQREIDARCLGTNISMPGRIEHGQLLAMYVRKEVDLVVLPSIVTDSGHHEGIPVALLEAMACSIPVVSTDTGSIAELIGDGSGEMVRHSDSVALAGAIRKLVTERAYYERIAMQGRLKVEAEYDLRTNVGRLADLFATFRCQPQIIKPVTQTWSD